MNNNQEIQRLVQSHKALEPFDYKIAVDWAIDLIQVGKETENILMLASFSEPIEKWEISPYVTAVLDELGLHELECDDAIIAQTHFILLKILKDIDVRKSLRQLYQVCINNDMDNRIMTFYLLYHAWDSLEEIGDNYYYDGATLENIERILKKEARKWIDEYINGISVEKIDQKPTEEKEKTLPTTMAIPNKGFIAKLKDWFS
ncbi:hypothetical protein [Brumimicrobium mesophilum]|uniref:hypothetical protein n=1 Tax=Brumimicrobium mesophilum TaxID=392717 RepID=UPI000D142603|nr:hypothetical protein [Brumimicrobium mesophilum]